MSSEAVWVAILGSALLFGGLSFCVGVAWYHGKVGESIDRHD